MRLSYVVWAAWLALFLLLELLGFWRVFGWVTLSETVWRAEVYPLVAPLVFATLVALIAHFLYHRPLLACGRVRAACRRWGARGRQILAVVRPPSLGGTAHV